MLFLYLMTSPHCNMARYYRLPALRCSRPTWNWRRYGRARSLYQWDGLCDTKASVVLIPNYLKYNQIRSQSGQGRWLWSASASGLPGGFSSIERHARYRELLPTSQRGATPTVTLSKDYPIYKYRVQVQSTDKHIYAPDGARVDTEPQPGGA